MVKLKWMEKWFICFKFIYFSIVKTFCASIILFVTDCLLPSGKRVRLESPTLGNFSLWPPPPIPLGISNDLPLGGGGMDIFWNYTLNFKRFSCPCETLLVLVQAVPYITQVIQITKCVDFLDDSWFSRYRFSASCVIWGECAIGVSSNYNCILREFL